jgi:hypothetical protein
MNPVMQTAEVLSEAQQIKFVFLKQKSVDQKKLTALRNQFHAIGVGSFAGDQQKKAGWINLYNALTCYWIVNYKLKGSMLASLPVYFLPKMRFGGLKFSLDDIEHGILRKNQRAPHKLWRQFRTSDIRNTMSIKDEDYRIHFALNCGAISCPAISSYNETDIENQLFMAEQNFANQEFIVHKRNKTISASAIFKMYEKDFKKNYIGDPAYKSFKIEYKKYNWTIG